MEYRVSYDYRDYMKEETEKERRELAREELAEYPEDPDEFIAYMKKKHKYTDADFEIPETVLEPQPEKKEMDPEEFRKMVLEVFAERDKILAEEQKKWTLEKMIEESREEYSTYEMFDFGLGKMSNETAIMDFYGYDLYDRIKEELTESYNCPSDGRKRGQISKALWQEIKDIRAGKKKRPEDKKKSVSKTAPHSSSAKKSGTSIQSEFKVHQRTRQPGDDYYLKTERGVIRNKSYLEVFKGPSTVYEVLWANIVRKDWHDTADYPIRERYYEKGMLVCCTSYRDLARRCKMSHNTVRRIIEKFENAGVIQTELLEIKDKKQCQTVFILGRWIGSGEDYEEHYFKDEVFLSPRAVKS